MEVIIILIVIAVAGYWMWSANSAGRPTLKAENKAINDELAKQPVAEVAKDPAPTWNGFPTTPPAEPVAKVAEKPAPKQDKPKTPRNNKPAAKPVAKPPAPKKPTGKMQPSKKRK